MLKGGKYGSSGAGGGGAGTPTIRTISLQKRLNADCDEEGIFVGPGIINS
jgi:hypothetical protein